MQIIRDKQYTRNLLSITAYISDDKKSAAISFLQELDKKINTLKDSPLMCRKSIYFHDDNYRDMILKGYTIIYKVEKTLETITILDIFKWQDR